MRRVTLMVLILKAGVAAAAPPPAAPPVFADQAAQWGLTFRYDNGATGEYFYPEIVGGGVALLDYDNDGDLDVFLVQARPLAPGAPAPKDGGGRLFRNDLIVNGKRNPEPRFVDVTAQSGIRALGYGMGVAAADVDNDGWVDLYVLNFGKNQLWHNNGDGTFSDWTDRTGLGDERMSLSASFADLDGDGWLDLYVADYVEFSPQHNPVCYAPSSRRDYCGPSSFPPVRDRLYRNRGDGTFEDVSLPAGITTPGSGMGVVAADLDGDGRLDLFVANDGMQNFLWRNLGGWRFENVALAAGVALNGDGRAQANMGIAAQDFDDDGDIDLFVTHIQGEGSTLWMNLGRGMFEDRTAALGLAAPTLPLTGFGTGWIDVDNDGKLDLLAVNGAVRLDETQAGRGDRFPYAQKNQVLRNVGGRFVDWTSEAGPPLQRMGVARGAAFGDIDNDGDTDVVVVMANGPAQLLVNQVGSKNPWLGLRLVGRPAGARGLRDEPGARIEIVRDGAPPIRRRVSSDGSYAVANDPRALVGLGGAARVTEVLVVWPDGRRESFPAPPLRAYTTLLEGSGRPTQEPGGGKP
ncbi:MAG: CRTAC1 family protein [Acidobacteriota bacterium]